MNSSPPHRRTGEPPGTGPAEQRLIRIALASAAISTALVVTVAALILTDADLSIIAVITAVGTLSMGPAVWALRQLP